ncbi:MAG: transcription-repair coupling factor [Cyclobacteriaceae bacterium]|nr:transcription-repair coupling factor [Cyclobacteriaceae bacterium]
MKVIDFIKLYQDDIITRSLAEILKPNSGVRIQLKGLSGSLDAVVGATISNSNLHQSHLFIFHDREEAAYFQNDLQNLMGKKDVFFFPTSYKRPYEFEDTENANVLLRTELINILNTKGTAGALIVSYPEALCERIVNKRSLKSHTIHLQVGKEIDVDGLFKKLIEFDFEKEDFVYEAGQFAMRGGIIDVFSYANEMPYRIELFGNEIESIRTFDPNSQLSLDQKNSIGIIPNIQTRFINDIKQSFLSFLPKNTKIWFKDVQLTLDTIDKYHENAKAGFDDILSKSNNTQVIQNPELLFETHESLLNDLDKHDIIEFGNRFYFKSISEFTFNSEPQPSFNKNFELIAENLTQNQQKEYKLIIAADSFAQIDRLTSIFEEIDPELKFDSLNISLRNGFIDHDNKTICYTDHQLFERYHKYKSGKKYSKSKALTLNELKSLQTGDYVTHIDHGVGRFVGLDKIEVNGNQQEAMRLIYKDDDILYVSIYSLHKISKYSGREGAPPAMSKLGSPEWEKKKKRVRNKVKDIAKDLIALYAKRKAAPGFAFSQDNYMQAELESSFLFEDTPDQATATEDVKIDMQVAHPMDRLICGDVGFGKTEIAIRAAFKAILDGKQIALLVPTTILAMQHYRTFKERLQNFPVVVEYINRFKSSKEIKRILKNTVDGKVDILIGTHRIVNKDVTFKDLGLLVIDEEQKFGVSVKEKLKKFRVNVDVLTLTATPIPRTLHFSLMGARDLSIIATPPPNRQPVTTEIQTFSETIIRDAISFELRRGGQVFFVHNRIKDIDQVANIILKLVPDAKILVAHGQMEGNKLEKSMMKFIEGLADVLVSTNIIESGLDIPNANTIIINHAHMFGLSDLHQMRGRVGRSNKKAFCYLLSPPTIRLSSEARKRLKTLEEFSHLGDGFKVSMRDLDIRGAGNLLGAEQSGFINDLGFDTYHKILDEAVQELKETEFKDLFHKNLIDVEDLFSSDCVIDTDFELLIPDEYISNISERLRVYNELDNIQKEEKLKEFIKSVEDRFGPLPHAVKELVKMVRLRWDAEKLGFEKLSIKNETFKAFLISSENERYYNSPVFGSILKFVQQHSNICKIKDGKNRVIFIVTNINSLDKARHLLKEILKLKSLQMQ